MDRRIWLLGIVLCCVGLSLLVVGCSKAPTPEGGGPVAGMQPRAAGPSAAETPAGPKPDTLTQAWEGREKVTSYEMTVTESDGEGGTMLVKLGDGTAMKMKVEVDEGWMIMDMAQKAMFMYDADKGVAFKLPIDQSEAEMGDMPTFTLGDFDTSVALADSEELDGIDCWVVDTTPKGAEDKVKLWVDKKHLLVRKIEEADELITFTYDRINGVADSEFDLPEGVEITDMGAMLEGLENLEVPE